MEPITSWYVVPRAVRPSFSRKRKICREGTLSRSVFPKRNDPTPEIRGSQIGTGFYHVQNGDEFGALDGQSNGGNDSPNLQAGDGCNNELTPDRDLKGDHIHGADSGLDQPRCQLLSRMIQLAISISVSTVVNNIFPVAKGSDSLIQQSSRVRSPHHPCC